LNLTGAGFTYFIHVTMNALYTMRNAKNPMPSIKLAALLLCCAIQPAWSQDVNATAAKPAAAAAAASSTALSTAAATVATPAATPAATTTVTAVATTTTSAVTAPAAATPVAKPVPKVLPPASNATPIDAIAVVVNDEVITRRELEMRIKTIERRMKNQNVAVPPADILQKQVLERMIIERAQIQQAKESGINIDDIMLDRAVARIAEQNKMSMQEFRNQLEREGTPFAFFRQEIRDEIIMQRLREREVESKVQIADSEVENFLAAEASSVASHVEFNLAQIMIRIPENATPEVINARRARAEDVMRQLRSGANFATIAATYSDSGDALKGGETGWKNPDRMAALFHDAIINLKPGQLTGLLKSPSGFHILKVLDKRTAEAEKPGGASVQQTHVRHILIKVSQVVTAAEAKKKLLDLKTRLENKAATFEDLAKSFSNDGSASKGGDLGWIYPGDTVPEFEAAMNALQPGQVSDPVESPFGFHLIEVLERKTDDVSKERQRQAARQVIRDRRVEEAAEDWLRQLRDRTFVEYRQEDK